jgi:hypothetical protein
MFHITCIQYVSKVKQIIAIDLRIYCQYLHDMNFLVKQAITTGTSLKKLIGNMHKI